MSSSLLWIALRDVSGLQRRDAQRLLERFGSPDEIFRYPVSVLAAYCPQPVATALTEGPDLARARRELARAEELGLRLLTPADSEFPSELIAIPDPPLTIYLRGTLPRAPGLAVVGARRATVRGREVARGLAAELAQLGVTVVSGLAYGIDAAAHRGALDAGGVSVAVLASGLDRPSPQGNVRLARRLVAEGGGWVSEYLPGTPALPFRFPERNRLISGLARAVLVIEARRDSGSLWTANHALDQGREVLAVPGPIDTEQCRGSNRLLHQGARPCLDAADLIEAVLPDGPAQTSLTLPSGLTADALRVMEALREGPGESDALARELGLSPADFATVLLELEFAGLVIREGTRLLLTRARRRPSAT
jgi:DNA processing protein